MLAKQEYKDKKISIVGKYRDDICQLFAKFRQNKKACLRLFFEYMTAPLLVVQKGGKGVLMLLYQSPVPAGLAASYVMLQIMDFDLDGEIISGKPNLCDVVIIRDCLRVMGEQPDRFHNFI